MKKLIELLRKHYLFAVCVSVIIMGVMVMNNIHPYRTWDNPTDVEVIDRQLRSLGRQVIGAILIGSSLISIAILKLTNSK